MTGVPLNSVLCANVTRLYELPTVTCLNIPISSFIKTFSEINEFMKMHMVNLAEKGLRQVGKCLYGAKVVVMGLAYKKNINDPRESPSITVIEGTC